jgi:hypothetical protein
VAVTERGEAVETGWGKTVENVWGSGERRGNVEPVENVGSFPHRRPQPTRGHRTLRRRGMKRGGGGSPRFHTLYYYCETLTLICH